MVNNHDDKANTRHRIEVALIAMRSRDYDSPKHRDWDDPFCAYQDGFISKRKLIELIANELTRD